MFTNIKITKPCILNKQKTNIHNIPFTPSSKPPIDSIDLSWKSHQETMEPLPSESKIRRIPSNSEVESETPNFRRAASGGDFWREGKGREGVT